jgi:coenzyme F420 hydrogenase subunit beta
MSGFDRLLKEIVNVGLCTGCGTCVSVCPNGVITFDQEEERPVATLDCKKNCILCLRTCPGKDIPIPHIEEVLFGRKRNIENREEIHLGISRRFLKGYATDSKVRNNGASGGIVTALLLYGKDKGIIDGAVVSDMDAQKPWRTVPKLARTSEEIRMACKSKYVIVPNNAILKEARRKDLKRLALVGCPCHINGVRKIQLINQPKKILKKIDITIGIFCGINYPFEATSHLIFELLDFKSLDEIRRLEYRGGESSQDFVVEDRNGNIFTISSKQRRTIFACLSRDRCRMCIDWAADLADISIGDIFYPGTTNQVPNWSAIIVRTQKGDKWISKAERSGYLRTFPLEPAALFGNFGFEGKKHGAVYTLLERRKNGWPVPDYHLPLDSHLIVQAHQISLKSRVNLDR